MRTHPNALSPLERGFLFAAGVLQFRPAEESQHSGKPIGRKNSVPYGHLKRIATRFVDGEFGTQSLGDCAREHGLNYESFKSCEWKIRNDRKT